MKRNTFKQAAVKASYNARVDRLLALIGLVALFCFSVGFFAGSVCSLL